MLHNQKIIFVNILDNQSKMIKDLGIRIWHHELLVKKFLQRETCVMGKTTYELTQWKGEKSWVLTSDKNWKRSGIGTIHDLADIHLHSEGPIYILGGQSIFFQLADYVDEIHMYVINNKEGVEDWIPINMRDWQPLNYHNENVWSYIHLMYSHKTKKEKKLF